MWQEICASPDPHLGVTETEFERLVSKFCLHNCKVISRDSFRARRQTRKLKDVADPCPHLWLWIASFMGRLACDGEIPPMASPTYGRIVALANAAQNALTPSSKNLPCLRCGS